MRRYWKERVADPLKALLRQGLTAEGLALSLACGVAAGLFPVIGATTVLGLGVGAILRLNLPALQLANWLAYPLQLVMIVPLVRLGEWMAGVPPVPFSVDQIVASTSADPLGTLGRYGMTGLHGILGWAAVGPFVVLAVYRVLLPALRGAEVRLRHREPGPETARPPGAEAETP